jgi:hypothetical protein
VGIGVSSAAVKEGKFSIRKMKTIVRGNSGKFHAKYIYWSRVLQATAWTCNARTISSENILIESETLSRIS